MIRKSFAPAALLILFVVPAFAGVPVPQLPKLDFGTPVETCIARLPCKPDE